MSTHPVFCEFNGTKTRIGTAHQSEDGSFVLVLGGTLGIGPAETSGRASGASSGGGGGGGVVFPPYGRSKGAPIAGASMQDLEFYKRGCERSLNDPSKSRWHDRERQLLAAIEAEIARQGGGAQNDQQSQPSDDDSELTF